jgi:polysaccharide pyruvyl transferase WcaK-like protein
VRVRGPRSAASLAAIGVDAVVVGDPALALGPSRPTGRTEEKLLGVNVGVADDRWGDQSGLVEAVVGLARTYVDRGWSIRLVPASADDADLNLHLAARIGRGVEIAPGTLTPRGFLDAVAPCTALVGEKLHSVVLGAAVHVPAVALEYRPKCRDFQESIGRDRFVVRTDRLDHDELVGLVDEIVDDRDGQVEALVAAVAHRQDLLRQAATDIRATVDA